MMHRCSEEIPGVNVFCGVSAAEAKLNQRQARIGKGWSFTRADKSPKRIALERLRSLCRDGRKPVLSEAEGSVPPTRSEACQPPAEPQIQPPKPNLTR